MLDNLEFPMYDFPNIVGELRCEQKHTTPERVETIKDVLMYFQVI
ncbi:hypothetical protein [Acidilutibacter cellobiosedens]|nr:hypothetical protein [Acidilutibacter cellobiosedens]